RSFSTPSPLIDGHASLLQALLQRLRLPFRTACVPSPTRPLPSGAEPLPLLSRTRGRPAGIGGAHVPTKAHVEESGRPPSRQWVRLAMADPTLESKDCPRPGPVERPLLLWILLGSGLRSCHTKKFLCGKEAETAIPLVTEPRASPREA